MAGGMRKVTIRMGPTLWSVAEEEAARDGISVAQFVRDATLWRVAWQRARRGDGPELERIEGIVLGARENDESPLT